MSAQMYILPSLMIVTSFLMVGRKSFELCHAMVDKILICENFYDRKKAE